MYPYNCVIIDPTWSPAPMAILLTLLIFPFGEEFYLTMSLEVYFSAPNQPDFQHKEAPFLFLVKIYFHLKK